MTSQTVPPADLPLDHCRRLARMIHALIVARGLSRSEVAANLGVSPDLVRRWCSADRLPAIDQNYIDRLAEVLDLSESEYAELYFTYHEARFADGQLKDDDTFDEEQARALMRAYSTLLRSKPPRPRSPTPARRRDARRLKRLATTAGALTVTLVLVFAGISTIRGTGGAAAPPTAAPAAKPTELAKAAEPTKLAAAPAPTTAPAAAPTTAPASKPAEPTKPAAAAPAATTAPAAAATTAPATAPMATTAPSCALAGSWSGGADQVTLTVDRVEVIERAGDGKRLRLHLVVNNQGPVVVALPLDSFAAVDDAGRRYAARLPAAWPESFPAGQPVRGAIDLSQPVPADVATIAITFDAIRGNPAITGPVTVSGVAVPTC